MALGRKIGFTFFIDLTNLSPAKVWHIMNAISGAFSANVFPDKKARLGNFSG